VPAVSDASPARDGVPLIPVWVKEWGFLLLGVAFLILTAMIADVGHAAGDGTGWFLFILLAAAYLAAWAFGYQRRLDKAAATARLRLYARSCLEAVDAMGGHQFEDYYTSLIGSLKWTGILVTGRRPGGDGGADILATGPHGTLYVIQVQALRGHQIGQRSRGTAADRRSCPRAPRAARDDRHDQPPHAAGEDPGPERRNQRHRARRPCGPDGPPALRGRAPAQQPTSHGALTRSPLTRRRGVCTS
jgi:hypothetical protein